jgi:hypothetical protein
LIKAELIHISVTDLLKLGLKESKKIIFSEFNDEPLWSIENDKIIIIDSSYCIDPNIIFN